MFYVFVEHLPLNIYSADKTESEHLDLMAARISFGSNNLNQVFPGAGD